MVILHIAAIWNDPFSGVSLVVPQHVISQKEFATTGLMNIKEVPIKALIDYPNTQIKYEKPFDIKKLPEPFNKLDLVVFHECYRFDYISIGKNLKKNNIRYIVIPHGELRNEAQKKKWLKKKVANLLLFNRFINNATAIQCLSNEERNATSFGKKKIVGTNGISIPEQYKKGFSIHGVHFLYIGRYEWKVKGLDMMFQAINIEADFLRKNNVVFELYGPDIFGRLNEVKNLVVQNKIEDIVKLNLAISGKEKERKLLEADIFIQTSRHEGMPMGILEAMSYGLPCVLTEGTTFGYIVEEIGAGWNGGTDSLALSKAIVKAVRERKDWVKFGANARKYVKAKFSWNYVSQKTISEYKQLLFLN